MENWAGRTISHYEVQRELGRGGMGVVYLARDTDLDRLVVLKTLKTELASDPRLEERFRREARACASVTHPNITTIYEINRHEGVWYICMEHIEGRTLRALLLEQTRLPIAETIRIIAEAAAALGAAHEAGIVHRDVKPENIMVTGSGKIKVLDFGLAVLSSQLTQPFDVHSMQTGAGDRLTAQGIALGTIHYMSPEQARGGSVTTGSDVFSLGAVLYECLAGMPPFRGANSLAVMHSILYDKAPLLSGKRPDCPAELEAIVMRALSKQPAQRFPSCRSMGAELRRLGPSSAPSPAPPPARADTGTIQATRHQPISPAATTGRESATEADGQLALSRLVGRDVELRRLAGHLERALGGTGSMVLVAGEAGIGKTRLVGELARIGEQQGSRYITGRCLFREGGLPYHPFVEAADRLVSSLGLGDRKDLATFVEERIPALVGRLPILESFLHVGGTESTALIADKEHLLDAISALFLGFARERPLILHIDDLHWADQATIDLFSYLARNCRQSQGLIIGTYRPEELETDLEHPLGNLLSRMSAGDLYDEIRLGRLGAKETSDIVQSVTEAALAPEFIERLHRETAGNPFFVLETLKLLVEDGTLTRRHDAWVLARSVERVQIPGRVHDVVTSRLARVPTEDREVLEIAAVEGIVFHSGTISSCLERPRLKILGALQRSEKEHHLLHAEEDRYTFDHPLIREILYEQIIPELRREYHRLIGDYLSSHPTGRPGEEAAVAFQYLEAGAEKEALPFLLDAGDRARRLFANAEALSLLDRAAEIVDRLLADRGDPEINVASVRLHKERGRIHQRTGNHELALKDFKAMQSQAMGAGLSERQAHALCLISDLYYAMGDYDEAWNQAELARDLASGIGDKRSLSNALRTMGAIHLQRAEYEEALEAHNRSIELQREIDDLSGYAENLNKIGNIHLYKGDYEKAESVYIAALALGRQSGNRLAEAESLNNVGVLSYYCGKADEALEHLESCLELKKQIGDKRSVARSLNNLALVFEMQGDLERAVQTHQESLGLIRSIGDHGSIVTGLNNLASVLEKMGRMGEALAAGEESLRTAESIGDLYVIPYPLNSLGRIQLGLNRTREAESLISRALELSRSQGQKPEQCLSLQNLAAVRVAAGRVDEAADLVSQALGLSRELKIRERESELVHMEGLIRAGLGDRAGTESCASRLQVLASELKLGETDLRRLQLEARVALMADPPRRADAIRALGEAARLASEIGLRELEWQVRRDLAEALGPGPEADEQISRAASVVRAVSRMAGSKELTDSYLGHPGRKSVLERAEGLTRRDDPQGQK